MIYDIWVEGHCATGERSTASHICQQEGRDFADACHRAFRAGKFAGYGGFDAEHLTLWACQLFDNETNARKGFG